MTDESSAVLVSRWRERQDQQAAEELFHRYVDRLVALARSRLQNKLAPRVDAEDVAQSVYRSFFRRIRDGRLDFHPGDNLWRLLGTITVHKVHGRTAFHYAEKRSITN